MMKFSLPVHRELLIAGLMAGVVWVVVGGGMDEGKLLGQFDFPFPPYAGSPAVAPPPGGETSFEYNCEENPNIDCCYIGEEGNKRVVIGFGDIFAEIGQACGWIQDTNCSWYEYTSWNQSMLNENLEQGETVEIECNNSVCLRPDGLDCTRTDTDCLCGTKSDGAPPAPTPDPTPEPDPSPTPDPTGDGGAYGAPTPGTDPTTGGGAGGIYGGTTGGEGGTTGGGIISVGTFSLGGEPPGPICPDGVITPPQDFSSDKVRGTGSKKYTNTATNQADALEAAKNIARSEAMVKLWQVNPLCEEAQRSASTSADLNCTTPGCKNDGQPICSPKSGSVVCTDVANACYKIPGGNLYECSATVECSGKCTCWRDCGQVYPGDTDECVDAHTSVPKDAARGEGTSIEDATILDELLRKNTAIDIARMDAVSSLINALSEISCSSEFSNVSGNLSCSGNECTRAPSGGGCEQVVEDPCVEIREDLGNNLWKVSLICQTSCDCSASCVERPFCPSQWVHDTIPGSSPAITLLSNSANFTGFASTATNAELQANLNARFLTYDCSNVVSDARDNIDCGASCRRRSGVDPQCRPSYVAPTCGSPTTTSLGTAGFKAEVACTRPCSCEQTCEQVLQGSCCNLNGLACSAGVSDSACPLHTGNASTGLVFSEGGTCGTNECDPTVLCMDQRAFSRQWITAKRPYDLSGVSVWDIEDTKNQAAAIAIQQLPLICNNKASEIPPCPSACSNRPGTESTYLTNIEDAVTHIQDSSFSGIASRKLATISGWCVLLRQCQ